MADKGTISMWVLTGRRGESLNQKLRSKHLLTFQVGSKASKSSRRPLQRSMLYLPSINTQSPAPIRLKRRKHCTRGYLVISNLERLVRDTRSLIHETHRGWVDCKRLAVNVECCDNEVSCTYRRSAAQVMNPSRTLVRMRETRPRT